MKVQREQAQEEEEDDDDIVDVGDEGLRVPNVRRRGDEDNRGEST